MGWLHALWAGRVPLPEAFWWYGIVCGFAVNALATVAALMAAAAGGPAWLVGLLYGLPIPYNLLALAGVWRSADGWTGAPQWARRARLAMVLWTAATTVL